MFLSLFIFSSMLKTGLNFVFKGGLSKLIKNTESLKNVYCKNRGTFVRKYFNDKKFEALRGNSVSPVFKNFSYKKPSIVLGGFLTFLGIEKPPEEPELIMKIKKGILLMQRKQYENAEIMLHWALELAQEQNDFDGITYVCDVLANLYFETEKPAKAEKLFVTVLQRLLSKGEPEDSNKVVHISLKLAKLFHSIKDFKKAEQGFSFCLDILNKKLDSEDEDTLALWGMGMDWYARFLLDTGRKNEALECFKKAYDMCVKLNGIENEQTVILLNDLGTVHSLIGDTDTALNYFEKAKDVGSKLPEMEDLPAIYINIGQLYLLKEMFDESKKFCQEGLRQAKLTKNEVASSEAKHCLNNIEEVLKRSSNKKQGESVNINLKKTTLVN